MQSLSHVCCDSQLHFQLLWNSNKTQNVFSKPNLRRPKRLNLSCSLKTSYGFESERIERGEKPEELSLPVVIRTSGKSSRYYWDGTQLKLVSFDETPWNSDEFDYGFRKLYQFYSLSVRDFFIPQQVQENYMEYVKWKFLHGVSSSALRVLATQAMFRAMGFGYSKSLPSAAALNWVLKDGLGRLSRCIYTASLASAFDTNLKRVRFSTSIMFTLSIGVELLTPVFPRYFLLLATLANVAKQISLAGYLATGSAVHRSFAVAGNIGEVSAKAQIQTVCFDNIGLMLAALLNMLCKNNERLLAGLPFVVYPIFSAIDLLGIYQGLKHVHLQTLTKDRLEIILDRWIRLGHIPSPAEVSKEEGVDFPWRKGNVLWPIRIGCVDPKDPIPQISMLTMQSLRGEDSYFICMETTPKGFRSNGQQGILLCLREESCVTDIIMGLLQACYIREELRRRDNWKQIMETNDVSESLLSEWFKMVEDSKRCACTLEEVELLTEELHRSGWSVKNILLSVQEQVRYNMS